MGSIYIDVDVVDSDTGSRISGASVTLCGRSYRTDGSGPVKAWFSTTLSGTSAPLLVTSSGYKTYSQNVTLPQFTGTTQTVSLAATGGARVALAVVDSVTKTGIDSALVFVDADPAKTTDSSGKILLALSSGNHNIKAVKAPTYGEGAISVAVTTGLAPSQSTIELTKLRLQQYQLTLNFEPTVGNPAPTQGAIIDISLNGRDETVAADEKGQVRTSFSFYPGDQVAITATKDGWEPFSTTLTVKDSGPYTFQLQKSTTDEDKVDDPTLTPVSDVTPVDQSGVGTEPAQIPGKDPDPYEYIYPSNEYGKYFTVHQARMYIGNLFVDELNTVQYMLQANRVPVYGYASRDFDAVGNGKALVQGQIRINFISEGYLYTILKEYYKKFQDQATKDDPNLHDTQQWKTLNDRKTQLIAELSGEGPDIRSALPGRPNFVLASQVSRPKADVQAELASVQQQLDAIATRQGPNLTNIHNGAYRQLTSFNMPDGYVNAVYLPLPFDIELQFEGAGRKVTRKLEACFLGANEQLLDMSGDPIGEIYGFIARRLR